MRHDFLSLKMILGALLTATIISGSAFCQRQKSTRYSLQEEHLYKSFNTTAANIGRNGVNNNFYQARHQMKQWDFEMNNHDDKTKNIDLSKTMSEPVSTQKPGISFDATKSSNRMSSPFKEIGLGETRAYDVNIKAVRDFVKTFKNIDNNIWIHAEDGSFTSTFTSNGIKTIVAYDRKGYRLYIMKVYEENMLAFKIRDIVKREYSDATITLVKEIETVKGLVIYVHMQNKDTWKVVRFFNGEMALVENFNKG